MATLESQVKALHAPAKALFASMLAGEMGKIAMMVAVVDPFTAAGLGTSAALLKANPGAAPVVVGTLEKVPMLPVPVKNTILQLIQTAKAKTAIRPAVAPPPADRRMPPPTFTAADLLKMQAPAGPPLDKRSIIDMVEEKPFPWKLVAGAAALIAAGWLSLGRKTRRASS